MSRRATRFDHRDANEPEILRALAQLGVEFFPGPPLDGWCWLKRRWVPCEIKNGRGRLTDGQRTFIEQCDRDGRDYRIWRSWQEAILDV